MRKAQKKQIERFVELLGQAQGEIRKALERRNVEAAAELLEQCQTGAIELGSLIEKEAGDSLITIRLLEEYCELLYQLYERLCQGRPINGRKEDKTLRKALVRIENSVRHDIQVRLEAVFLPYKASMWDSLESIWRAANEDSDCDAYVIPIPYYDRNPDGSFREMHYEGELYPDGVPITWYEDYDFETRRPDMIFIHNPYDDTNYITSVHPSFYMKNLKRFTEKLIYVPYFTFGEKMYASFCVSQGTIVSDIVIAHSDQAKTDYIKYLHRACNPKTEAQDRELRNRLSDKIFPLGSPKIDKVVHAAREMYPLPEEWASLLSGKKAVLYNTGISGILSGNEQALRKIIDTIQFFRKRKDVVLWWRPHPLITGTMLSLRPHLYESYLKLIQEYQEAEIGIFDDTADLHRAIIWTDLYYGDDSSLIYLYGVSGKPIVLQNVACLTQDAKTAEDQSISFRVSCAVSNSVYFVPVNYNRLYRLDLPGRMVHDLGDVPRELKMEASLYSNIIHRDGTLWLVPSRAHALAEYQIATGRWTQYELPDRIKSSAVTDARLYMISSDYRTLWTMDLEEKRLEMRRIGYRQKEQITLNNEYYNDDLYLVNQKLYYLITHSNLLAVYDLESGQAEFLRIGPDGNEYQRFAYDGSCFWFWPYNMDHGIVCWDGVQIKETAQEGYPKEFFASCGFMQGVFRDEHVWLFPYRGNMVLRLDKRSMALSCALALKPLLGIEDAVITNVQELPDGRLAMAACAAGMDSTVTILDSHLQVLEHYSCVCPGGKEIAADRIFERLGTEEYTSAYAYQTDEGLECSLSSACDALAAGETVYQKEKEYFRSIYANSDGSAGASIWKGMKQC